MLMNLYATPSAGMRASSVSFGLALVACRRNYVIDTTASGHLRVCVRVYPGVADADADLGAAHRIAYCAGVHHSHRYVTSGVPSLIPGLTEHCLLYVAR